MKLKKEKKNVKDETLERACPTARKVIMELGFPTIASQIPTGVWHRKICCGGRRF